MPSIGRQDMDDADNVNTVHNDSQNYWNTYWLLDDGIEMMIMIDDVIIIETF